MTQGLWDGFEYRASRDRGDVEQALKSGTVAIDTNVLLDLYRYVSGPREELFQGLEALGPRLFIASQVAVEFWRGREAALNDTALRNPPVTFELEEFRDSAISKFNEWANRVALDRGKRAEALSGVHGAMDAVVSLIRDSVAAEEGGRQSHTAQDLILQRIVALSAGRVGIPPEDVLSDRRKEGLRRADAGLPPGYKDKKKNDPDRVVGDYLFWCEAMDKACRNESDLVLITRDTKEDWWTIVKGEPQGPRIELIEEFWSKSNGRRLYMLRPSQFVSMMAEASGGRPSAAAQEMARAERALSVRGWTEAGVIELLHALQERYAAQYRAVVHAAFSNNQVTRDKIYDLAGFDEDRTLRGFGRPVNRLARDTFDPQGELDEFPVVFDSVYDPSHSWVQAAAFALDPDLGEVIRDVLKASPPPADLRRPDGDG